MFREYLEKKDKLWMLTPPVYRKILPAKSFAAYTKIRDAIKCGKKIYVHPDPDIDGFLSAKCWDYCFKRLGYTNYTIGILKKRIHIVKASTIQEQIDNGASVIIIVDSSSNELEMINEVCSDKNIQLIIIDHHPTMNKFSQYPNNCEIVNPKIEGKESVLYSASAGVVNSLVCDYILYNYGITDTSELEVYGYITMYSDVCKPDNPYLSAYMHSKLHNKKCIPEFLNLFWDKYSGMNSRFIGFKINPIINANIRLGNFELINKYFFKLEGLSETEKESIRNELINERARASTLVAELEGIMAIQETEQLVICMLPNDLDQIYYNFMGYIANRAATKHNKPAISVYLDEVTNCYIGSARDPYSRDLLAEFSAFFEGSEGHQSAFGVSINKRQLKNLPEILQRAELGEESKDIVFDYMYLSSDKEILNMAIYNEFAIGNTPNVKVKVPITRSFNITGSSKKIVARTKTLTIVSFGTPIIWDTEVICTPQFNGTNVECIVN